VLSVVGQLALEALDLVREVLGRRRSGFVSIQTDGVAVSARFPR